MPHLRAGGVSFVVDDAGQVVHWGAAIEDDAAALTTAAPPARVVRRPRPAHA